MERWMPCKLTNIYNVSDEGRVMNRRTGRIMKTSIDKRGYETVQLSDNCKKYDRRVHRLVAEAFDDGSHEGMEVTHRDKNRRNNRLDNLEWSTRKEIIADTFRNGREQTHRKKPIRCIETGVVYESIKDCSECMGIDRSSISKRANNPAVKSQDGYHFEFVE